jgi:cytochrome P450
LKLISGAIGFGHEYKATESNIVEGKELELAKDIDEMTKIISRRLYLPDFIWNCFGLGVDDVKNVGMRERFESFVKPLIAERKAYWESQKERLESSESSNGWNILDRLLYSKSTNAKGEAEGFTESEILEELLGFFGAGYETTSNSVVWAFSELSQRPDIVEKIRKEIKSVCEMKDGKWDIVDHLNDLKYLVLM